jgi:hypothetical protein
MKQKKLMYYPLMLDIIRVLKELSDFSHLDNEIKVFVTDLLRMISVFFNYMRSESSDSLSVTNLFKKQLKYPDNFDSYINRHNNMLQRIGINNTQYNDWKTTVNENPCAYDKINTMLYNIWSPIVNVNVNNRKSIKCLLCILEDFFKNIKFSLMGWYMYTDFVLSLGTACKKSVQTEAPKSVFFLCHAFPEQTRPAVCKEKIRLFNRIIQDSILPAHGQRHPLRMAER